LEKRLKMRIDILTVLPELLDSPLNHSMVKRAREKGLVEINVLNLRDFAKDKYKTVDD
jgi:tRNA (guanine37-N1)-methyltransferase